EIQIRAQDTRQDHKRTDHFHWPPTGPGLGAIFLGLGCQGETLNLRGIRHRSHVAYGHHHDCGYEGNQDAEVLKIDVVHDPQKGTLRVMVPADERHWHIHHHPERADKEANDHGPKAALRVQAFPKNSEKEHNKDRWREVALHGLQVVVQPFGMAYH